MASSARVVFVTAPSGRQTNTLARKIIEMRLAACVNIVPGLVSHYEWKGRLHQDKECLLILKTVNSRLSPLRRWLEKNHPYEVFEFVAFPVSSISKAYFAWMKNQLGP
jgi:periplasmic divalent cation tolerance protein